MDRNQDSKTADSEKKDQQRSGGYTIKKADVKYNATVREGWGEPIKLPVDTDGIERE